MKSNSYNALQIVSKVYRHTLKAVPFSGILGVMNYLVQGLFPAVTALVLAKFFDASGGSRAEYHAESCLVWQFVCRHICSGLFFADCFKHYN